MIPTFGSPGKKLYAKQYRIVCEVMENNDWDVFYGAFGTGIIGVRRKDDAGVFLDQNIPEPP